MILCPFNFCNERWICNCRKEQRDGSCFCNFQTLVAKFVVFYGILSCPLVMGISDEEKIEPIRLPSQNHETDVCLRHPFGIFRWTPRVQNCKIPCRAVLRERILRAIGEKISQSKP